MLISHVQFHSIFNHICIVYNGWKLSIYNFKLWEFYQLKSLSNNYINLNFKLCKYINLHSLEKNISCKKLIYIYINKALKLW